jgi:hypothetical protein
MGKTATIEKKTIQPEAEKQESTCQHHWVIATPRGAMSEGRCKRCGEEREFRNSAHDYVWEGDSGSGYNAWRGTRPARGPADDDEVAASPGSPRQAMIA